ncbi:glycosyltransferase [Oceanibaculum indicum]|uniref:Putative glycosyl transferase, family 2 n=1 Tax=Oceanibaculum indicum P24 TaxID=1207063 RepID=K2IJH7_9PROT|nr:glycosyltransferase [Oceanibaculum indicum]EKE70291.1 Putative glycosyl transferase, family 2 [Oceanibaculum indicum P24]
MAGTPSILFACRLAGGCCYVETADAGGVPDGAVFIGRQADGLTRFGRFQPDEPAIEAVTGPDAYLQRTAAYPTEVRFALREALGLASTPAFGPDFAWLQRLEALPARQRADRAYDFGAGLTLAIPCGDAGLFLRGWLWDPHGAVEGLTLISPFGERPPVTPHFLPLNDDPVRRHFAPDGLPAHPGPPNFAAFVPLARDPRHCLQVRLEIALQGGLTEELVSPVHRLSRPRGRDALLASLPAEAVTPALLEECVHPALSALNGDLMAGRYLAEIEGFGAVPASPTVSIIVPLYGAYDFLDIQAARFGFDPGLRDAELIYVLDRPEDAALVRDRLDGLHRTYGLACRLAVCAENYGYGPACMLGAGLANAPLLLFLNADVVPEESGWLARLAAFHRAQPDVGVTGPRLLFPDGGLQHAGLFFSHGEQDWWVNRHYWKGFPGDHPPALASREVPGVTGACLMIDAGLFRQAGGFDTCYVLGDFEDSTLALACRALGRRSHYCADVALVHQERTSMALHPGHRGGIASAYNGWLQDRVWGEAIAALMADPAFAETPLPVPA